MRRAPQPNTFGGRAVVKAQVHAGGRGQAGGVKVAQSSDEAASTAAAMLSASLVTKQTGPEGVPVNQVLIEELADIAKEMYLALTVDRGRTSYCLARICFRWHGHRGSRRYQP